MSELIPEIYEEDEAEPRLKTSLGFFSHDCSIIENILSKRCVKTYSIEKFEKKYCSMMLPYNSKYDMMQPTQLIIKG